MQVIINGTAYIAFGNFDVLEWLKANRPEIIEGL